MPTRKKAKAKTPKGTKATPTMTPKGKRVGRPPMADQTVTMAVRVPVDLVEALDAYSAHLRQKQPWHGATRGDAVRRLLMHGLSTEGFLRLRHIVDGLAAGGAAAVHPAWKQGGYMSVQYLNPMPDPDAHPDWWGDAPDETGEANTEPGPSKPRKRGQGKVHS